MTKYLLRRFPDLIVAIELLLKKDTTFREICCDYEEASAWLADYCHSESLPSISCDRCRELIGELEGEIIEAMREAGI